MPKRGARSSLGLLSEVELRTRGQPAGMAPKETPEQPEILPRPVSCTLSLRLPAPPAPAEPHTRLDLKILEKGDGARIDTGRDPLWLRLHLGCAHIWESCC